MDEITEDTTTKELLAIIAKGQVLLMELIQQNNDLQMMLLNAEVEQAGDDGIPRTLS